MLKNIIEDAEPLFIALTEYNAVRAIWRLQNKCIIDLDKISDFMRKIAVPVVSRYLVNIYVVSGIFSA